MKHDRLDSQSSSNDKLFLFQKWVFKEIRLDKDSALRQTNKQTGKSQRHCLATDRQNRQKQRPIPRHLTAGTFSGQPFMARFRSKSGFKPVKTRIKADRLRFLHGKKDDDNLANNIGGINAFSTGKTSFNLAPFKTL